MRFFCAGLSLLLAGPAWAAADGDAFFETEVRPLFVEHCLKCHGDAKPKGGLRLTSRAAVLRGGESGPAAVVGKPDESLLVRAVRYQLDALKMPPKGRLGAREVDTLARWVKAGLPWPEATATARAGGAAFRITDEQRRFWAFQPVRPVTPPAVQDACRVKTPIDRFIRAKLEAHGLAPAAPADKRTLIRRATFDLIGLPPTPEEIDAFLADESPDAFARVVDRLLASPHYGERWGRHWLDLVRYTDSFDARVIGNEMDINDAWRYRDWVVRAFNKDLPYDRFLAQQVAGDLLPPAFDETYADGVIATGMLAIGNWGGGDTDKEKLLTDIADDQVDVVGKTFLGLTLACARCHDHKFDPISQADYYGLAGIFFSTHILPNVGPKTNGPPMLKISLLSPAERARRDQRAARRADAEKRLRAARDEHYQAFARRCAAQTTAHWLAAWDYQTRPADQRALSLADFAAKRGLLPFAVRRCVELMGLGDDRLLDQRMTDVLGHKGVFGWRGPADCPSLLVNTNDAERSILTFKLPPRSVAVHPGPASAVVLGWTSPVAGTVSVRGRLADADPAGGDGVAWSLVLRRPGGRTELASGDLANGAAQNLADGRGGSRLLAVQVQPGDSLELAVSPKQHHTCDTTVVEWTIATADGSKSWGVPRDFQAEPLAGNPRRDGPGGPAVWHVAEMAGRGRPTASDDSALSSWHQAASVGADRESLERAAAEVARSLTKDERRGPFWIADPADERYLPAGARAALAQLAAELDALRKTPEPPTTFANGAQEGGVPGSPHAGVHDIRVHVRGRYDRLGDLVPRRFPEILAGDRQPPIASGSGRRELAAWLARPENPLTARVMVNRLWQFHFGQGLVRTPSNFGRLGELPTHPELLDGLAVEFIQRGWSVKAMHRLMMLSATYQQSSVAPAAAHQRDPDNRLWARMNRRRLEAEALRDGLLAVAGRLDRTAGGPADRDFTRPRRTLYQMTVRSDRAGYGPLFDAADPTAPVEKRTVSTVAPQALFLMNHPFVTEQATALAKRITSVPGDDAHRIGRAYRLVFGRAPSAAERQTGLDLLAAGGDGTAAWEGYCQVLLCTNEFTTID